MTPLARDEFTFGIEEEFFLIQPGNGNAVPRVPKLLLKACRKRIGEHVSPEMLQSQIELSSPVFSSCAQARAEMTRLRAELADVVGAMNYRLVAAGTHPLASWTEQRHTDKPRYERLMDDFQIIGRRNVLCGLHVHVAIPEGLDRVRLMNRVLPWLPLFLALSTSSPFWNRQRTGLLSYRQAAYDEWPRTGIPDHFADEAEYNAFVNVLVRAGAARDASFLWWAIRPATRYPTLELRIADSCTRVEDSLAIAALYRCLIRRLARTPDWGTPWLPWTRRVIDENRWRAKRHGIEAQFIDPADGGTRSCAQWLNTLRVELADDVRALGCEAAMARLTTIMARGTSAHEQLAVYRAARDGGATRVEALRRVVDWLVTATVPRANAIDAADEGVDDATETTEPFAPPVARGLVAPPEAASALA